MLIYHYDGWYEYRTFDSNLFCNTFSGAKKEIAEKYNIDIRTFLN